MSTLTQQEFVLGLFEAAPATFLSLRQLGKESFYAQGMPALKSEEYKFTPIAKKLESCLTDFSAAKPVKISSDQVKSAVFAGFEGVVLVFSNGQYLPELSNTTEGLNCKSSFKDSKYPSGKHS